MCLSSVATIVNAGIAAIPKAKLGTNGEHCSDGLGLGILSLANWKKYSKANKQTTNIYLLSKDTATEPGIIFCRLYSLHKQIMIVGTTFSKNTIRNKPRYAIAIFGILPTALIEFMIDKKDVHWVELKAAATQYDAPLVFNNQIYNSIKPKEATYEIPTTK